LTVTITATELRSNVDVGCRSSQRTSTISVAVRELEIVGLVSVGERRSMARPWFPVGELHHAALPGDQALCCAGFALDHSFAAYARNVA
jgi:hypothetical protein